MAKKIKLNGTVVGDRDAWIYDWLEIPYISPSSVHNSLEDAAGDDVEVYISSSGGNAWSGSEIHTALKEYSGFVTVKIPAIAGSAASVIAMAGDKVLISPTGQIMIHNSATWTDGNKEDHQQTMRMLQSVDEAMVNAYEAKTGKPREELRQLMVNETFMNAQRAVELGFADEIMFSSEEVVPVANASLGAELPPAVLDKFRSKIMSLNSAKPESEDQNEPPAAKAIPPIPAAKKKEEPKAMDINELRAKHPELFDQIKSEAKTEATTAERSRINALNDMAKAPGAAAIVAEAIKSGKSVEAVAIEIVTASSQLVAKAGDDRVEDAKASGAAEVQTDDPTKSAEAKKAAEDAKAQSEVDEVTAEIQRLTGGK